jgi:hypothetical protein
MRGGIRGFGANGTPLPIALPSGQDSDQMGLATAIANPLGSILDPTLDGSDYFFYDTSVASIAPGVSAPAQIQIDAGTDFLWLASTFFCDVGGDYPVNSELINPLITCSILDTGATKTLMNQPVPLASIASPTASFPYRLIRPRLFRANSVINFTFTSYDGNAVTYSNLHFTLHGIRKLAGSFNT